MTNEDPILFHFSEIHLRAVLMLVASGTVLIFTEDKFKDAREGLSMIEACVQDIINIEKNRVSLAGLIA
jgi:hypothetical protein